MSVTLREITESDLENIMRWRMDPEITRYMNTNPKLTLEGQKAWLASIRANPDVSYWFIEVEGQPAGVINLTGLGKPDGNLGWAYYVGEKRLRSMGTALSLEMSLYDHALVFLKKKAVYSDVFSLNRGVIQLHRLCGCETVEEKKHHVCKEGIWYDVTYMRMTAERWLAMRDTRKYTRIPFPQTSPLITFCGDNCTECPRYQAHSAEDLRKAAELWYRVGWRDSIVSDEEIRCSGCTSHKECTYHVVECIREQGVGKCNQCGEFPCGKISDMLKRSKEYQKRCREVCTEQEYESLAKAFFEKEENLRK